MTTIVLVTGFSAILTSQTRDHRVFAGLAIVTLVTAFLCDLVLLPALLSTYYRARKVRADAGSIS